MLAITEIFGPTIQGEGPLIGQKCIFIRFYGCDYKCKFCDQKRNQISTIYMPINKIIEKILILSKETKKVILTGGNPCIQDQNLMTQLV